MDHEKNTCISSSLNTMSSCSTQKNTCLPSPLFGISEPEETLCIDGEVYSRDTYVSLPEAYSNVRTFLHEWYSPSPFMRLHTSGSTGTPKEFIAKKAQMRNSARLTCSFLGLQPGNTALLCMPLGFIAGKMMLVRGLVAGLNFHILSPCGEPLAKQKGRFFDFSAMVPLQIYNSLQSKAQTEQLKKIGTLLIGGGAISSAMEKELSAFKNDIYVTYGMTETLSHIALRRVTKGGNGSLPHGFFDAGRAKQQSGPMEEAVSHHSQGTARDVKDSKQCYVPFPSVELSLSGEGTLVIHAPAVCEETLYTRDIAKIYPDNSFEIIGRLDNVINTGGIKVQIEKVEAKLASFLPSPFAITSVPHEKYGEAVTLLLEKEPFGSREEKDRLCHEMKKILSPEMRPKYVFCVHSLPLTTSSKINRTECKQLALSLVEKNEQQQ